MMQETRHMKTEWKKKEDMIGSIEGEYRQIKRENSKIVTVIDQSKNGIMTMITITKSKINILNWNARGIRNKKDELSTNIYNYDIVILTETKMSNKERLRFKGYNVIEKIYPKKINSAGGIAIVVRNDLGIVKLKEITLNSTSIEI